MQSLFAFFGLPGQVEVLIVLFVVVLLFGHRIPSLMRNMGRGITEFKAGMHSTTDEDQEEKES